LEPYLRNVELNDPIRLLYKGTIRVLLVLLHDFPEFLCEFHFTFCDVIPPTCIQMRNLILSAFPRNMRLPDPFTPNLKVDLLPEINQPPRILSSYVTFLAQTGLKQDIDDFIQSHSPALLETIKAKLSGSDGSNPVPLLNALVLYAGVQAIQHNQANPSAPITHNASMDLFQYLAHDFNSELRYLFFNALANQLRYPNNHTHYFSCVLLFLFAEANNDLVKEQITRVLLERLIVNRPHPWGLLITFIELIKNPRYKFWNHGFTRCAPEIERVFEYVARSCLGRQPGPLPKDEKP
jgi:CCR4-NOT transcription complex subunit 1